mmetsp:Transcript_9843/g.29015  ORF Transcript_9843/g.29015 Transcript_9843/m.29015 type:complete len:218 (-) Transcript_9843:93-746(-)
MCGSDGTGDVLSATLRRWAPSAPPASLSLCAVRISSTLSPAPGGLAGLRLATGDAPLEAPLLELRERMPKKSNLPRALELEVGEEGADAELCCVGARPGSAVAAFLIRTSATRSPTEAVVFERMKPGRTLKDPPEVELALPAVPATPPPSFDADALLEAAPEVAVEWRPALKEDTREKMPRPPGARLCERPRKEPFPSPPSFLSMEGRRGRGRLVRK